MPDADLGHEIQKSEIVTHAYVVGELAVGSLHPRSQVPRLLRDLPHLLKASDDEVLEMIAARNLSSSGIGFVDAHLLASLLILSATSLWTFDRRFAAVATRVGVAVHVG